MNYWLVKTEPETYSFDTLLSDKKTIWDGIRNYQARNYLKDMKKGDWVLVYHTGSAKEIYGIAKVTKPAFPDPADTEWLAIELAPVQKLKSPVPLTKIKTDTKLNSMVLLKNSRLSVQPITTSEFDRIIELSEKQ